MPFEPACDAGTWLSAVLTGFVQQKRPQRLALNVMARTMGNPMIPA